MIHLDFTIPLDKTNTLNQKPAQGDFRIPGAKVVVPGAPFRSVLFYRLAKSGPGRMPHVGSEATDQRALRLIHDWILNGTGYVGPSSGGTVRLAENADSRWAEQWEQDEWGNRVTVDGGVIEFDRSRYCGLLRWFRWPGWECS